MSTLADPRPSKTDAGKDSPGAPSYIWVDQIEAVDICRTVYAGTLRMREESGFLPQFEKESDTHYDQRLQQAVLFNAFKKTIRGMTGMAFRQDPAAAEDLNDEIWDHLENVDLAGSSLGTFLSGCFREKLLAGHYALLIDWHGPEGARSEEDETQGEARPYWTLVRKEQIIRPRVRMHGGQPVLLSFAYIETEILQVGEFGEMPIERVRQLDLTSPSGEPFAMTDPLPDEAQRRVLFRSWIRTKDDGEGAEWEIEEEGKVLGDRMTRIPVVVDYFEREGFFRSSPPFLDLALENIRHWQIRSDRDQNLHTTSVPIFLARGVKAEDLQAVTIGNAIGLALPKAEQDAGYREAEGNGLSHTKEELADIEKRMAALGISMLERQVRVAETEKAKMLDKQAQDSELANQVRLTGAAVLEALKLHGMWMGVEDPGSVEMNYDFEIESMTPEMVTALLSAVEKSALSRRTFWDRLEQGRILGESFDPDLEEQLISEQGSEQLRAEAEAAREIRQIQMVTGDEEEEVEEGTAA